jgi:hypothetical protein
MLERYIQAIRTDDPGLEEPAATRERLKGSFAPGAVRRMTQLGLLVGAAVGELAPTGDDTVVYASAFGETRTLAGFLDSFPTASPTLFQTSVHPSSVQQVLIGRQRSVREFFPLAGGPYLVGQAVLTALLAPASRALLCGGEERGLWMTECGVASPRAFAFALALTAGPGAGALGRLALSPTDQAFCFEARSDETTGGTPVPRGMGVPPMSEEHCAKTKDRGPTAQPGGLSLADWFDVLHFRRPFAGPVAPGWQLKLEWS